MSGLVKVPSGKGGRRPGAGRPKKASSELMVRNPETGELQKLSMDRMSRLQARKALRDLLEPVERAAVIRLTKIILKETDERPDIALEAIRMVMEYRHGKPGTVESWGDEVDIRMANKSGMNGNGNGATQPSGIGVLVLGGGEAKYIENLRNVRKLHGQEEKVIDLSEIPPPIKVQ
jgi:hypothetical protein